MSIAGRCTQAELAPVLLRRMKEDVETLPEKEEVIVWVQLTQARVCLARLSPVCWYALLAPCLFIHAGNFLGIEANIRCSQCYAVARCYCLASLLPCSSAYHAHLGGRRPECQPTAKTCFKPYDIGLTVRD
jgi:hypothetical protein